MRILNHIVTFFIFNSLAAQNLVPNPGFEDEMDGQVKAWQQPGGDYYHYYSRFVFRNNRPERTSINGLCLLYPAPSEYMVVKLISQLQKGKTYCMTIDAELGNIFEGKPGSLKSVEFAFSHDSIVVKSRTRLYLEPAVSLALHPNDSDKQLYPGKVNYVAKGDERYLIIGKFFTPAADSLEQAAQAEAVKCAMERDAKAQEINAYYKSRMPPIAPVNKKYIKKSFAKLQDSIARIEMALTQALADNEKLYTECIAAAQAGAYQIRIYFDNVCVAPLINETTCNCNDQQHSEEPVFIPGKTYRLNTVQFDLDKATLKPGSYAELDHLYLILTAYPNMQIRINGHTDSLNTEEYNVDLSNRRAREVYDYLVERGIEAERLSWQGFGESVPVAGNQTEEGRAINRRVEFLVIKNE